jgi:hypothetical protein
MKTKNEAEVKALADQMKNGRWRWTGEDVRVDATGRVIDGQWRIVALTKQ